MDLTEIRNRVIQKTGVRDPDFIDAEINFVQRQYIQPVARLHGEAYYTSAKEQLVEGEALTTTDGGLTYSFEHSPVRRGSLKLYDAAGDEIEEGSANYPAVDYDNGGLVFTIAEPGVTADYRNVVVAALTDIATDIYRIDFVADITSGTRWNNVRMLPDFETESFGLRLFNGKLYFHGVTENRTLLIGYHRRLADLSDTNLIPDIDEQWHDLYWLGAAAMINADYYPLFTGRLNEFKMERISEGRPHGTTMKIGGWW